MGKAFSARMFFVMEKNNQNNMSDGQDDVIIEEEMDNSAEAIRNCGQDCNLQADKGEYLAGSQRTKADSVNARRKKEERGHQNNFPKRLEVG